jgi:hypothetical protein
MNAETYECNGHVIRERKVKGVVRYEVLSKTGKSVVAWSTDFGDAANYTRSHKDTIIPDNAIAHGDY